MKRELTLPAAIENIEAVTDFVNGFLDEIGCPMKIQMKMAIIIDEIFSNIAYYAYGSSKGDATVTVDHEEETGSVVISFSDYGKAYNPLENEDPDVTLSADERQIGGMGIFMVKNMMDDIFYEYVDGQNVLTMKKKL